MKRLSLTKGVLTFGLAAVCMFGMAACSSSSTNTNDEGLTGGVAATVNGTEIQEDKVTKAVQNVRESQNLTDEQAWGEWLAAGGYTPESVREQILDSFIEQELITQYAGERNVTVEESEIQGYVDTMKNRYESEEAWQEALSKMGMTEDDYRTSLNQSATYNKVIESFSDEVTPSDESMIQYAQTYGSYYNGAKRSSHILFESNDEAKAQEVLDQINAGEIDFAEAARQYSKDTGSASNGGDVGWDKLTTFADEYQKALDGLEVNQVSALVPSDYGFHIIKCTEVFTAPETITSMDQLPAEFYDAIKDSASESEATTAYNEWIEACREKADVVVNPMPENVPYNVDMSKYETEEESSDASSASAEATSSNAEVAVEGEGVQAEVVGEDGSVETVDAEATAEVPAETPAPEGQALTPEGVTPAPEGEASSSAAATSSAATTN